ncbi:MAG: YkgJ family cysteine cluster protein [Acidobacteria bacterium]|nr:YkgJ family cysteine cluster protein [Acidobacteriota bacterium]
MPDTSVNLSFELKFVDRTISASVALPARPATAAELLPVFQGFSNAIIGLAQARAADAGLSISCRKGCAACCRLLVPVAEPEARHLSALAEARPQVRQRFAQALRRAEEAGLGEALRSAEHLGRERHDALMNAYLALRIPCPFLEDELCTIYETRPLQCREYFVLTPPENCERPTPETVQGLALPLRPSQALHRLGQRGMRWIPLVLALEWTASHRADPQHMAPAPELFREFLDILRSRV